MGLLRSLLKLFAPPDWAHQPPDAGLADQTNGSEARPASASPWLHGASHQQEERAGQPILKGRCWVIDGDTIVINRTHVRLAGIDAPELDQPYGQNAKRALMQLCRGQLITAVLDGSTSHDRVVGTCHLKDGRDLSAEMVKAGHALDWAKHSGGLYRHLEEDGLRKRLWRVDARQKGRMPPSVRADRPFSF
jgi:endonuclease YncB( thermonuclease family)